MNDKKLIIVEGPDCCGKTTLAKALAETLDAVYWHFTSSPALAEANTDYMRNGLENARDNLAQGRHVVFDRFWPSEWCYGRVLRPAGRCVDQALTIRDEAKDLDPIIIFCKDTDGMESAVKRHNANKDPEHPYRDHVYGQIYGNYLMLQTELQHDGTQSCAYYFDDQKFRDGILGVDKAQLSNILSHFHLA